MFSNKSANSKALAVAFVSMLMLCSFAMVITSESDAEPYNQHYDIHMRVGDEFTYTPTVNLQETTITASGNALTTEGGDLTWTPTAATQVDSKGWSRGTVSGTFTDAATYNLTLEADWDSGSLHQDATQTITFHVYDRIAFSNTETESSFTVGEATADKPIVTVDPQNDTLEYPVYATMTQYTISKQDAASQDLLAFDSSTGVLSFDRAAQAADAGTYVLSVTAEYTYTASGASTSVTDSKVFTYTVYVGENITIDSGSSLNTWVDNPTSSQNTYTVLTNYDDKGVDLTYEFTVTGGQSGHQDLITPSGNTFVVDTEAAGALIAENAPSMTFTVHVKVSGDLNGNDVTTDAGETAETDVNVIVFAGLEFTSAPSIENASISSATGNSADVLATAQFDGATKITYYWGDGTSTTVNVSPDSGSKFSARHVYSEKGMYAVTITAENTEGDTKAIMLYDATSGAWNAVDEGDVPADEDKSFFEEHGILFIILAILGIVMFLLFFFGFLAPYTLIAGFILVIAAVACFITGDFGITEGLIEDLNI